jgi:hypothetical protein
MEVALSIVCGDKILCYYYYYNLHTKWTILQRKREKKERKKERKKKKLLCNHTHHTKPHQRILRESPACQRISQNL